MQIITTITQACDEARKKFNINEQKMLIDIYNGTMLMPQVLGGTLLAQVEDSFILYPEQYEQKWGVKKEEMIEKIKSLSQMDAALIELWAVGFWALNTGAAGELENYIASKLSLAGLIGNIIVQLSEANKLLEKTKSAFKSRQVAEARKIIDESIHRLINLQ